MITEFLTRIRFFVFRKRRTEFDDELRFHLEQSITAKVAAGLSASEARRQALIEFGGVEAAREQCDRQSPGWWVGTVAQDMRYALRGILAHRWFSAAIVLTLALGIGLNTMVFTLVNAVLFKPVPVPGRHPPCLRRQPQCFAGQPGSAYLLSRFSGISGASNLL